jgi:serine/threonine-protein kinase
LGAGVAGALLVLFARAWVLGQLEDDFRTEGVKSLALTVENRVSAVRAWAERQKGLAREILSDPLLASDVAVLLETAERTKGNPSALKSSPSYLSVVERMTRARPDLGGEGFVLASPSGIGLCAEIDTIVGRPVAPTGAAYLRRCILGEWIVSRPYPDRQFALGLVPNYEHPMMFVGGPVYDPGGKVLAMGVFRFSPHREFYPLLGRGLRSVLAFDEKGTVLNDIGEIDLLHKYGLIPGAPGDPTSIFRLPLREPGGDLTAGYRPEASPESWVPTLMVRRASRGERGASPSEYSDVLGRPVLGAWDWLPEWEMGIGAERPLVEVLAPTRPVRTAFGIFLLAGLALTGGLLLVTCSFRGFLGRRKESTFGSYVLVRPVGKGGMAKVFLARHDILKRPAAVKILDTPKPDPMAVARFEREARLACRLGHPNTIQIFDYGETPDGRLYYAMEYVEGVNLAQLMAIDTPVPVARALFLLRQVCGALEEVHELGLVHRDLKPSNIMVSSKGGYGDLVKVLDFGIACSSSPANEDFTLSLEILGTPAYIAPERIRNPQSLDPLADIYSFGAVAFHLLTGRNVFEGPGPTELLYQVMTAKRPSPSQLRGERLPEALERLILDCLSIDPELRPSSFEEIRQILESIVVEKPWTQKDARAWWTSNRERLAAISQSGS